MTTIKQRHAGYHDTPCDCRWHVLDCFAGSCEGCAQPAPAPPDLLCSAIWNGCVCTRKPHPDNARHVWRNTLDDSMVDPAKYPAAPPAPPDLVTAALALFDPMDHGSPSHPNEGHTVEAHCAVCVSVRSKRTQDIRRALVAAGALPSVGLRVAAPPAPLALDVERDDWAAFELARAYPSGWFVDAIEAQDSAYGILARLRMAGYVVARLATPEPTEDGG